MSIHEILITDENYHLIEQEHNGVKYAYISNIDYDNILAIFKHNLPIKIEKEFKENKYKCFSTFYVWVGYEDGTKNNYHIIVSLAVDDLNRSQRELYGVTADNINTCIKRFLYTIHSKQFIEDAIEGLRGAPVSLPTREVC